MVGVIQIPPAFVSISASFVRSAAVSISMYVIPACESHAFACSLKSQLGAVYMITGLRDICPSPECS
jgi:hypothetical protein